MFRYQKIEMKWTEWHHRLHKKLSKAKDLIPEGSCLLLSVSGGQDSMALTKLCIDLQRIYQWELNIWHGDHGWHKESGLIAKELKIWCEKRNLTFYCNKTNRENTKTEKLARDWRYSNLFARASMIESKEKKSCKILTAHTGSDRAETLLMNLARGSDLGGLTSLREKRILQDNIELIRPLLNFSREETKRICDQLALPIWLDPSNKNLDLKRNKIRNNVLPVLEELHHGSSLRIAALAERLSHYQDNQTILIKLALKSLEKPNGLCRIQLMEIPLESRLNLIAKWMKKEGLSGITATLLEEISYKISKNHPTGSKDLQKDWKLVWTKDLIKLIKQDT